MKKKLKSIQFERDRIEALLRSSHSQKEIAQIIGRDKSTIFRERKRSSRKVRVEGQGWKVED